MLNGKLDGRVWTVWGIVLAVLVGIVEYLWMFHFSNGESMLSKTIISCLLAEQDRRLWVPGLPMFLTYIPLANQLSAFVPRMKQTKNRRNVSLVVGIPSAYRAKKDYLNETLTWLLNTTARTDEDNVLFVILISDLDEHRATQRAIEVTTRFQAAVDRGLMDVVVPSPHFYPNFTLLYNAASPTLQDKKDRAIWRSKQVLDFIYLMMYSMNRGLYYLQLEDDIIAAKDWIQHVHDFIHLQNRDHPEWMTLQFSSLGYIGKLFRNEQLSELILYFAMFFQAKPVDFLWPEFVRMKVCKLDAMHNCAKAAAAAMPVRSSALFQHRGFYSSLEGKIQKLQDHKFQVK